MADKYWNLSPIIDMDEGSPPALLMLIFSTQVMLVLSQSLHACIYVRYIAVALFEPKTKLLMQT